MPDHLTGLNVFARVAALGSLSGAARALGMSQTMASKHVGAIEGRLGVKLLHRSTRRLTLTEAGRTYLEAVERILADIAESEAAVSAERTQVRGTLRLNVPVSFGTREIAPLLPDLMRRHGDLSIDLGLNDRRVDAVEEGWDLVVRIGRLTEPTMVARRLAPCRMVICAAPAYLAARDRPAAVADLVAHDCLGYTLSDMVGAESWSFGRDGRVKVAVRCRIKANNGDALVAAAVAGQGIVYVPAFMVGREIGEGRLEAIVLDHEPYALAGIFAAYPASRRPPAKVRATIDFLVEHFAPIPPWEPRPGNA